MNESSFNRLLVLLMIIAIAIGGILDMVLREGFNLSPNSNEIEQTDTCVSIAVDIMKEIDLDKNCVSYSIYGCGSSSEFLACG